MIQKLSKKHKILCTSRSYKQVADLAKIKKVDLRYVGRHGGSTREGKLISSIDRMHALVDIIVKFSPDYTVSFCSPEASRISYGIGVKHLAFSDSPHAEAVMRLSVPLVQKLLIPWIIPKTEFIKFGISKENIIQYKAIDAAVIVKQITKTKEINFSSNKKTIVIRPEETEAAYVNQKFTSDDIIKQISEEFQDYNIIVLPRYVSQKTRMKNKFGKKIKIMNMVDGKTLLAKTDLFIGSGGTMTAEAALMGVPTISYDAVPNFIEKYLVHTRLVKRERDPKKISKLAEKLLQDKKIIAKRSKVILMSMEDPFDKLTDIMNKK